MNLKISTRLVLSFGILVAIMAVSGLMSAYHFHRLTEQTRILYEHPMAVANAVLSADGNIIRMHRSMKDAILSKSAEEIDQALAAVDGYERKVHADLEIARQRFLGSPELIQSVTRAVAEWKPIRHRIIALKREGKEDEATRISKGEGADKVAEISRFMATLKDVSNDTGNKFYEDAQRTRDETIALSAAISIAVVVLALGIGYWVTTGITRPLAAAVSVAEAISTGDLRQEIQAQGKDEISTLLRMLETMQGRLRNVARHLSTGAAQLAESVEQLSVSADQVARGSDEQSSATTAMSTAIEQMTVSIANVAANAHDAGQATQEAQQLSNRGDGIINSAIVEISKIAEAVEASSAMIRNLERESTAISGIAHVIQDIADQTNLLALNAAIEAARAGEQGRGFAVVADEVRKLAERTTNSTREISGMITKIQEETLNAVASMENGVVLVSSGTSLAQEAGQSIAQIKSGALRVAGVVGDIASSLQEQKSASEDLAKNVERIAQRVEENSAAMRETAGSAHHLQTLAQQLKGEAAWFKT